MPNYRFDLFPNSHITIAIALGAILMLLFLVAPDDNAADHVEIPISLALTNTTPDLTEYPGELAAKETIAWREFTVAPGDNLSTIFASSGLSPTDLHQIMSLGGDVGVLKKIKPGQRILFDITESGNLKALKYEMNALEGLLINKDGDRFTASNISHEPTIYETFRTGAITRERPSLYESGKTAGLSDSLLMELSYVFQWDISFALDLRQGDTYSLLFEENYLEGVKVRDGKILSAQFNNMGQTYTAVLYTAEDGYSSYFSPDGKNMRKAFLRDPVHFSRVSSSFNLRRLHPIHKRVMPHRGIDYAAKQGTPIVASGDGKVAIARQNNSSGKYIVIQHGEQYQTKYLHLYKFAKGLRAGKRVKQGEVIGYVGSTGWATAPHLHYEFLVDGVHRNPRTVSLPQADPIRSSEKQRFVEQTASYIRRLEVLNRSDQIASSED